MPKPANYGNTEILLAMIWSMPKKQTKGQIGRLLGIKSAGQKHWRERFEKLAEQKLLSIEKLDAGELFFGSPILRYHLTEKNLEEIWNQYFVSYDKSRGLVNDPFLTPFSAGLWNVTSTPEFSELVGSKFNYHFLCAKNEANPVNPLESIESISKEKIWKVMDSVLSVGWKTEAYRRKPVLLNTLNSKQKKTYDLVKTLYEEQMNAHPADYKEFTKLFDKNFKFYL